MKFIKYTAIGLVLQIIFLMLIGVFTGLLNQILHLSVLEDGLIVIYYPFIYFIIWAGNFKGESSMIEAPIIGLLLGVFFYSVIFGLIWWFFKRKNSIV